MANGCVCDICILLFLYYSYDYPSTGMVIGGGVGLLVVFVTFVLCCFYACCKRKLRYRQRLQGNSSNQGRNTVMPSKLK